MFFDAFGRLALGQVQQRYTAATVNVTGVSGTGVAGIIGSGVSPGTIQGVAGIGVAGTIGKSVAVLVVGAAGIGVARPIGPADSQGVVGTAGIGVAGQIGVLIQKPVAQAVGIGIAGQITPSVAFLFNGAAGQGVAGEIIGGPGGNPQGAVGIGVAGIISVIISGGGGGEKKREGWDDHPRARKRKTGFEPVAKKPAPAPKRDDKPKIELPPFYKPAPPLVPLPRKQRLPVELIDPAQFMPVDMLDLQSQIHTAQDMTDIADIMAMLELLD